MVEAREAALGAAAAAAATAAEASSGASPPTAPPPPPRRFRWYVQMRADYLPYESALAESLRTPCTPPI